MISRLAACISFINTQTPPSRPALKNRKEAPFRRCPCFFPLQLEGFSIRGAVPGEIFDPARCLVPLISVCYSFLLLGCLAFPVPDRSLSPAGGRAEFTARYWGDKEQKEQRVKNLGP